jgi:hypothetical protein
MKGQIMTRVRISVFALAAALCVACAPQAPEPAEPVAPVPESAAAIEAPSPDVVAAREAEARALAIAPRHAPLEQYADDIYEGPALMASYQGETVDGVYEGYGVLTLPDSGVVYAGLFARGFLNGPGTERDMQGELFHAGLYIDGLRAEWADQK